MTRGMVNTVLARLAGIDTTPSAGQNWYEVGTAWAKANGITDSTNPEASVTREQLATLLYRFCGTPEVNVLCRSATRMRSAITRKARCSEQYRTAS